jgi:MarR family transcriptional regulator, organic hydroperoxide resistance regulator
MVANHVRPHGYARGVDTSPEPLEVLLSRAGAAAMRHRRRLAAAYGLTPTAIAVLAALETDAEPHAATSPSQRELAGRLGLSPATLTPVLDALENAGEIRRERDRVDRRVVRVQPTAAGRARLVRAQTPTRLPRPDPELEPAVRAYLLAVLAAVEAEE